MTPDASLLEQALALWMSIPEFLRIVILCGMVMIAGQRAPVVGRVSMDLITVDVTDVDGEITRGDLAFATVNGWFG